MVKTKPQDQHLVEFPLNPILKEHLGDGEFLSLLTIAGVHPGFDDPIHLDIDYKNNVFRVPSQQFIRLKHYYKHFFGRDL